jgi:predicted phosphate transport protein (TIGR00153 family)
MGKKNNPYFDDFITMVNFSCRAAEYLQTVLKDFRPDTLPERRETMHEIEHAADEVKHGMMRRLVKEFVTPIDREDIIRLVNELDDVTDKIDDILIRMYMYNIRDLRPAAPAFADVIARCCRALQQAMLEFPEFHRKSATLTQALIDVNTLEEEGDAIYIDAVRKLYRKGGDPVEVAAWSEIFDRLEDCCDACEHVADVLEIIAMKNS